MTLTQAARLTKFTILGMAVLLVVGISGYFSYQFWYYRYYLPNKRPVEIAPDIKYSVLPAPLFPITTVTSSNFQYSLDTETGELPTDLPKILKVYFIPQLGTTLLAPNKARQLSENLGFGFSEQVLSPNIYKFNDETGGEMIIDINTNNFQFQKNIASSSAATKIDLPEDEQIISDFKAYLSSKGLLKEELKSGRSEVQFNNFVRRENTSALVTLWPNDLDKLKIVTPTFKQGLIQATLTRTPDGLIYKDLVYTYFEPDFENSSTYPLRPIEQAFNDLKTGSGVVIVSPEKGKASLTNIYLAYFEPGEYAKYLQPIYVFEGEGFVAYIPAISDKYLEKK